MSDLKPCPFCGGTMEEVTDEDGHYFIHPGRRGLERTDCWLADAWVSDEATGEGSIGEWNTRAAQPQAGEPQTPQVTHVLTYDERVERLRLADDIAGGEIADLDQAQSQIVVTALRYHADAIRCACGTKPKGSCPDCRSYFFETKEDADEAADNGRNTGGK